MNKRIAKRIAKTMAKWWADKLRENQPARSEQAGIPGAQGAIIDALQSIVSKSKPTKDAILRFESELFKLLSELPDNTTYFSLGVDYNPHPMLAKALELANFGEQNGPSLVLPWKTFIAYNNGTLTSRSGYGSPFVEVPIIDD